MYINCLPATNGIPENSREPIRPILQVFILSTQGGMEGWVNLPPFAQFRCLTDTGFHPNKVNYSRRIINAFMPLLSKMSYLYCP